MTREVSRQAFIRGAAALVGGAVLGGCRSARTASPAQPQATTTTSAVPTPSRDWAALANAIDGHVILPADGDFSTAKAVFNSQFDRSTPADAAGYGTGGEDGLIMQNAKPASHEQPKATAT
jgi:hypothetical protein